jgi:hypothetical protein
LDTGLRIRNGLPLYLVSRLTNDFDPIFCRAHNGSISFIGARDRLAIILKIINNRNDSIGINWNHTYAFDSEEVKRNIKWFTKSNANKPMPLDIIPFKNYLFISNKDFKGKLTSVIEDAPIPRIKEMDDGITIRIRDLNEMAEKVNSMEGEVVQLKYSGHLLEMRSAEHEYPTYTIPLVDYSESKDDSQEKITFCLKQILLISCQLTSELESKTANLKFYPGGAAQLSSFGDYISSYCLLTAVKYNNII